MFLAHRWDGMAGRERGNREWMWPACEQCPIVESIAGSAAGEGGLSSFPDSGGLVERGVRQE